MLRKRKVIMTDADVVRVARHLDKLKYEIADLIWQLQVSEHPNSEAIHEDLLDNGYPILSYATHVVARNLSNPERWETGDFGIRHKGAAKAVANLRALKEQHRQQRAV